MWWYMLGSFLLKFLQWLQEQQKSQKMTTKEKAKAADFLFKMRQCNVAANLCGLTPKEDTE